MNMTGNLPQGSPVRRVLLECTDTYYSNLNTGIQRVVRNVARECLEAGDDTSLECKPIIRVGNRYLAVRWKAGIARNQWKLFENLPRLRPSPEFWDSNIVLRLIRLMAVRVRKIFYPRTLVREIRYLRWSLRGETIVPGKGDTLVLLDAWWNRDVWTGVEQAKKNGARIGLVMYDLLPVTNPEYFKSNVTKPFTAALKTGLKHADYCVAISRAVRDALHKYSVEFGPPELQEPGRFRFFRLGTTLDMAHRKGRVREVVKEAFAQGKQLNPYLNVGTIEPRKNHVLLVDAFEEVWKRHPDAKLCIVGRVGWLCEKLITRIRRHPLYNRSLFMFNDLSDTELDYCYQRAKAFIFPSHAEGFGLPVVEALQHGLRVMVSDIPIHREVGRDFCAYFDARRPESLATLVDAYEQNGSFPLTRRPDEFALPDWAESTRDFIAQCLAACKDLEQSAQSGATRVRNVA